MPPLSSALHVLPPLAPSSGDVSIADWTLVEYLTVRACPAQGPCVDLTTQSASAQRLRLEGDQYHTNWKPDTAGPHLIHFLVADLEVASLPYVVKARETVPVKFRIDNHPLVRARVLRVQNLSATDTARVLRDEFSLGAAVVAQILSGEGYGVTDIAAALQTVFAVGAAEAAQILKNNGYGATAIAEALRLTYGTTAGDVTQILRGVGFPVVDVATALRVSYTVGAQVAALHLKGAGFSVVEIALGLRDAYAQGPQEAAQLLRGAGFAATDVAMGLKVTYGQSAAAVIPLLLNAGFDVVGVASSLNVIYGLDAQAAASLFRAAGIGAVNAAVGLKGAYGQDAQGAAVLLKTAGFGWVDIAQALQSAYGETSQSIALILKTAGFGYLEVAEALKSLGEPGERAARFMKAAGFTNFEVGTGLYRVFDVHVESAMASIFNNIGYDAVQTYPVLVQIFGPDLAAAELALWGGGYSVDEFVAATSPGVVARFAPVLLFDQNQGGYPMSAQDYFDKLVCGWRNPPGPVCNAAGNCDYTGCTLVSWPYQNLSIEPLHNGQVPTYYKITWCQPGGQLRITYWWFYGHQPSCDTKGNGEHISDWEHVMVTTSADRHSVAAVTYFQHGGWYTRTAGRGGLVTSGTAPIVYPGENSHGSFHFPYPFGTKSLESCLYFLDPRSPRGSEDWWFTSNNLVSLSSRSEGWMQAEARSTAWKWGHPPNAPDDGYGVSAHPTADSPTCDFVACRGTDITETGVGGDAGCTQSQCLTSDSRSDGCYLDCPSGYVNCGLSCAPSATECVFAPWTHVAQVTTCCGSFTMPTSDAGLR